MKKLAVILMSIMMVFSTALYAACEKISDETANPNDTQTAQPTPKPEPEPEPVPDPEKKIISYKEAMPFPYDLPNLRKEKVTVQNIQEKNLKFDEKKVHPAIKNPSDYIEKYISVPLYETNDLNEIIAVYDAMYRDSEYMKTQNLLLFSDLSKFGEVKYSVITYGKIFESEGEVGRTIFDNSELVGHSFYFEAHVSGKIEITDGRIFDYEIMYELSNDSYKQKYFREYINGGSISNTLMSRSHATGNFSNTRIWFGVGYDSSLEYSGNSPYPLGKFTIQIFDENLLETDKVDSVAGQFYELLKDTIFVYDYGYYSQLLLDIEEQEAMFIKIED